MARDHAPLKDLLGMTEAAGFFDGNAGEKVGVLMCCPQSIFTIFSFNVC